MVGHAPLTFLFLLILPFAATAQSKKAKASANSSCRDSIEWILPNRELGSELSAEREKLMLLGGIYRILKDDQYRLKSIEWKLVMRTDSMEAILPKLLTRQFTSFYGLPTNFPANECERQWVLAEDDLTLTICKDDCVISVLRRFNSHQLLSETREAEESGRDKPASFHR